MTELENNLHSSLTVAMEAREGLKLAATKLINEIYMRAGEIYSSPLSYGNGSDQFTAEHRQLTIAEGMQEMAVALGVLTKEEAEAFKKEYWENRNKIPLNVPDRF